MNIKFLFMRITSELTNVRYNQKKIIYASSNWYHNSKDMKKFGV